MLTADAFLTGLLYALLAAGGLYAVGTFVDALTPAKAKAAVRDSLHDRLHVGDPRTRTQRRTDDAFMGIVANYHREN